MLTVPSVCEAQDFSEISYVENACKSDFKKELNQKKKKYKKIKEEIKKYDSFLLDYERQWGVNYYLTDVGFSVKFKELYYENYNQKGEELIKELKERKQKYEQKQKEKAAKELKKQQQYRSSGFKSAGVVCQNGRRYTYYSSRALRHYRTGEWTPGADGIYRDSEGFIVVAASDIPQGATTNTPFGMGKVYDSGCAAGTTDIYTNY